MKQKLLYWTIGIVILLIVIFVCVLRGFNGGEDNWIKDSKGVWIKHGAPATTPDSVLEQQNALSCAYDLYSQAKANGVVFNSQCLGACENYSIDIVNVPRNSEDDKPSNQCSDYPLVTSYFIELDKNGEVVRVA